MERTERREIDGVTLVIDSATKRVLQASDWVRIWDLAWAGKLTARSFGSHTYGHVEFFVGAA